MCFVEYGLLVICIIYSRVFCSVQLIAFSRVHFSGRSLSTPEGVIDKELVFELLH